MADLTITAASLALGASAIEGEGIAGAAITQGQPVYIDSTASDKLKPCDTATEAEAACVGIATTAAADGQPCRYVIEDDDFTPGATISNGIAYLVSETTGGIQPALDLATTEWSTFLFIGKSTTKARLRIVQGGQKP